MNGEVIKSFLVGLGFGVDESSLAKFNKAISSASVRVAALYTGIQVAASGIFYSISKISEGFEQMGYEYRIIAPAINKALLLRRELLAAYRAAGINITKAVQESVRFNFTLAKTKFALEAIYKSVGLKFLPLLTKQMEIFRQKIYSNMPKIQAFLERAVKFIFQLFQATTILGGRLWSVLSRIYELFQKLDEATNGWSTKILAAVIAWKALNLAFLTTPLGMILTGLVALLALFDDLQTYKEGGKSLFNWKNAIPAINVLTETFKFLLNVLTGIVQAISAIGDHDFTGFTNSVKKLTNAFVGLSDAIDAMVRGFGFQGLNKLLDYRDKIDKSFFSLFQGQSPYFTPGNFATQPLGAAAALNSNVNQNLHAQTSIVVQGSPDPKATAQAIGTQQTKVNFDTVRNMKAVTR